MSGLGLAGYSSSEDGDETEDLPKSNNTVTPSTSESTQATAALGDTATSASHDQQGHTIGPALAPNNQASDNTAQFSRDPTLSPYIAERQQVRQLTMPPIPNFDIPPSPPASGDAELTVTNKKIAHFLALKREGIHYNEKLLSSSTFSNPAVADKLLSFAQIGGADQYRTSLPEGSGVNVDYWAGVRVEQIVEALESRRKAESQRPKGSRRQFVSGGKQG